MNQETYIDRGCDYFSEFIRKNSEFDTPSFTDFVLEHNKAGVDMSMNTGDIDKHEILRLARLFYIDENEFDYPSLANEI